MFWGGKSMRMAGAFALAVFPIIAAAAQDPARLQVAATGDQLSYEVVNLSPYQIVGFEVYTQFTSGGYEHLGCGVKANVKAPTDLALREICRLPHDEKTGKPVTYVSRILRVEFAGLTWTPKPSTTDKR